MALDNLRGGTKRVVEETAPLNNLRGGTKRVVIVDGGGGSVDYAKTVQRAETMPTADASNAGQQFLYSGESDATYTHGYIYECVSDGGNPATYAWTRVDVQPAPEALPDQTGQSGKFLTTDGTDASWSDKPLVNKATGSGSLSVLGSAATASSATNIGYETSAGNQSTVVGYHINAITSVNSVVVGQDIGWGVGTPNGSILLGVSIKIRNGLKVVALGTNIDTGNNNSSNLENIDENGIYWGTGWNSSLNKWGVYKLMSADGTVPTARLTKVNTTATLAVADWSSNTQTVTVSGVKADSVVFVSPAPASASDYASAGILCTAQAADSLTFTCTTTPSNAITVNVVCM